MTAAGLARAAEVPLAVVAENLERLTRAGLLARAREGERADLPLVVVMEPTGLAWLPVAVYLLRQEVTVYLVNSQQVADLRRFYQKHAKSDRIDSRVLAKLFVLKPRRVRTCVLLDKPERRLVGVGGARSAFRVPDVFVGRPVILSLDVPRRGHQGGEADLR